MPELQIRRKLPGVALRDSKENIPFYRGQVCYASERIQWVMTNHPEHKLVFLVGRTYLYWCPRCRTDVWQEEVTMRGVRNCPFCQGHILALSPGDLVRVHYRYSPDAAWAEWWAQRVIE
jgi:DNA-directed RNA polymerase subunit RPC12/RpoP